MNWSDRNRENAGRRAELRLENSRMIPRPPSEEHDRLLEILRILRSTADGTRRISEETAATRLKSRATRERIVATRERSAHLRRLLKSTKELLVGPLQQLKPEVKVMERGRPLDERSTAHALPAAAAHEINNPLEAIESLIYVLENEGTLSDKDHEYLAIIKGEVGRIAEIAQQSLANYRQTLAQENVDVAEVIDGVLDLYKPNFQAKQISVFKEHQFRGNIRAYSRQIREIFANLFLNAIDAMNSRGRLRIRIAAAREWSGEQRRGARILVADNGHGISPKHLHKIFEPSFTTKGDRGNGIGLSVVRDIMRAHRGRCAAPRRTHSSRFGPCETPAFGFLSVFTSRTRSMLHSLK